MTSLGTTKSERYLAKVCRRTFLSLWSYPNLHTDEGNPERKGTGKELCDLLVVFGNDLVIFSDKNIKFNAVATPEVAWKRWYKRAIDGSANQLFGAENWLRNYSNRIFLDPECTQPFPGKIPDASVFQVHRVAVALGTHYASKQFFGGGSGSLIINTGFTQGECPNSPFHVGHVRPKKGFIHVFDEFTLDAIFGEIDTVSDFVTYLVKRERFLMRERPVIVAAGEEQLLAIYLTKMNRQGEHDFVLPTDAQDLDGVTFDESHWERMVTDAQYRAKKEADKDSYLWDRLIEHFIRYGRTYNENGQAAGVTFDFELALRHMAAEPRLRRRQLGCALKDLMENVSPGQSKVRLVYSNDWPSTAYIFLVLGRRSGVTIDEYRQNRLALLVIYCKVAKLKAPQAHFILGISTDTLGTIGATEDLVFLNTSVWTEDMDTEARTLQRDAQLLLDNNITIHRGIVREYPDIELTRKAQNLNSSSAREKKKVRIKIQKASRRQNRKK